MSGPVHATAIVAGTTGLLFVGPSGAGKSRLAMAFVAEARQLGLFAALVADDRVFLEKRGEHLLARRPEAIRDLIEVRGSGIAKLDSMAKAIMHWAIMPIDPRAAERMPPERETHEIEGGYSLPLLRMSSDIQSPFLVCQALGAARMAGEP